jgi:DNA modification methylase
METEHQIFAGDSRDMEDVQDDSINLVVTSPPYPMIEMWDDCFSELNNEIGEALQENNGSRAFELMHDVLNDVWKEVDRVLTEDGIACINIGDATRTIGENFELYPNHVEITNKFRDMGYQSLPDILWRKPANSAAKFMGSGMLPPNAYATLEHEYILIFRKDGTRSFSNNEVRYDSAYFWEERNKWFSDVWTDIRGELQEMENDELRERSAAFPFEIPYRLINMYSVYGDTVLDPFWGTGTTTLASMVCNRNSVGYELEEEFIDEFKRRNYGSISDLCKRVNEERIQRHREFVKDRKEQGKDLKYEAENYSFEVTTKQEREIQFYNVDEVEESESGYVCEYTKLKESESAEIEKVGQQGLGNY